MQSFKYQPLLGLFNIDKKEIESDNVLSTLSFVEEKINPSPKGRAKDLTLFLYLINILTKANLSFYVKGGTILQYRLGEHARANPDIDVLVPKDVDNFIENVKKVLENHKGKFTYKVTYEHKYPADAKFYYDSFELLIDAYENGEKIRQILLDGVNGDIFDKVEPVDYPLPNLIEKSGSFKGVPVEFVFAEKVLAITSELNRPYKHLVDAYSLSNIDINIEKLKYYINLILSSENEVRAKLGIPLIKDYYQIREDKKFTHSYFFVVIQAGYKIEEKEMIQKVNEYLKKLA